MFVKALRNGLGRLIILIDFLTRPKRLQRSAAEQKEVETATAGMALYQFYACPFCIRTRRLMHRLNLPIETRDAKQDLVHRETLLRDGGKIQVPCLRIEESGQTTWLYETTAVMAYLEQRFDPEHADGANAVKQAS